MSTREETLTPDQMQLFLEPNLADLVTLMPDGYPQATPVWIDYQDGLIVVNTAEGRQKHRNVLRDPRVAVMVVSRTDDYRWVSIRGRVVDITTDGAEAHIDAMAKKYLGKDVYPWHTKDQQRVLLKIQVERVTG
ncbi:MAG: PPOX class F420-dependent oxidoreductase [Actinomycetota bacterium]